MSDLKRALNDHQSSGEGTSLGLEAHGQVVVESESDTVLQLDLWSRRKGKRIAKQWEEAEIATHDERVVADAHAALFDYEPKLAPNPSDASRAAWWKQFMETPEYRQLHNQTCLDTYMSALASKVICDQWVEYAAVQEEKYGPEGFPGLPGQPLPGSDDEDISDTVDRIQSVSEALKEAQEAVSEAQDIAAGLGVSRDAGELDSETLSRMFRRVRESRDLSKILALAGRMRHLAAALQRTKTRHGRDDMVGIGLGGKLEHLTSSEMMQLTCGVKEAELAALDRLARRRSLSRKFQGIEKCGKGPVIFSVDESGSMACNDKIITAKALAATVAWVARNQKRWCGLVGYSGDKDCNHLILPPGRWNQDALVDWLLHFFGGGTSLDCPLRVVPDRLWPEFLATGMTFGKVDHVMVTDAIVNCPKKLSEEYRNWSKENQVTNYGIVVGEREAGYIAEVCDQYWTIDAIDLESAAVEGVFSSL